MSDQYRKLEADLIELLAEVGEEIPPSEAQEVQMYLDAGEYGLAFETICSVLKAKGSPVSESTCARIVDLGERMDIEPDYWREIQPTCDK